MFAQKIRQWLRQPYSLSDGDRRGWRVAFFSGLFVMLFLFFLQPFGMRVDEDEKWIWLRISAGFGLVTAAVTLLWGRLERLLPFFFNEEKWQVWKEIIATLLFVSALATANMLFAAWRFGHPLSWRSFGYWQFATWSAGIFPTLYGVFSKQMRLMRRYSAEAATDNYFRFFFAKAVRSKTGSSGAPCGGWKTRWPGSRNFFAATALSWSISTAWRASRVTAWLGFAKHPEVVFSQFGRACQPSCSPASCAGCGPFSLCRACGNPALWTGATRCCWAASGCGWRSAPGSIFRRGR